MVYSKHTIDRAKTNARTCLPKIANMELRNPQEQNSHKSNWRWADGQELLITSGTHMFSFLTEMVRTPGHIHQPVPPPPFLSITLSMLKETEQQSKAQWHVWLLSQESLLVVFCLSPSLLHVPSLSMTIAMCPLSRENPSPSQV